MLKLFYFLRLYLLPVRSMFCRRRRRRVICVFACWCFCCFYINFSFFFIRSALIRIFIFRRVCCVYIVVPFRSVSPKFQSIFHFFVGRVFAMYLSGCWDCAAPATCRYYYYIFSVAVVAHCSVLVWCANKNQLSRGEVHLENKYNPLVMILFRCRSRTKFGCVRARLTKL